MKKFLSFVLIAVITVSSLVLPVSAEEKPILDLLYESVMNFDLWEADDSYASKVNIDISDYGVSVAEVTDIVKGLVYTYPELFFIENEYIGVAVDETGTLAEMLEIYFKTDKTATVSRLEEVRKLREDWKDSLDSSWSDLEIVLYTHDLIDILYTYDMRAYTDQAPNYDIYGLVTEGVGVCQSYSLLFKYYLNYVGIPCCCVMSDDAEHMWNAVKIGGKSYHVDVNQDDPVNAYVKDGLVYCTNKDNLGQAYHHYFLLTDEEIQEDPEYGQHYDWHYVEKDFENCNDKTFSSGYAFSNDTLITDGSYICSASSAFVYDNGYWYYIDGDGEDPKEKTDLTGHFCRTADLKTKEVLFDFKKQYFVDGGIKYFQGCFSGMYLNENHRIFYNTCTEIKSYDTLENKTYSVPVTRAADEYFYGLVGEGDTLYIQKEKSLHVPTYTETVYKLCDGGKHTLAAEWIVSPFDETKMIKRCDVCGKILETKENICEHALTNPVWLKNATADEDGCIEYDCIICKRKVQVVLHYSVFGDVNGDKSVDASDLTRLKKYLAGSVTDIYSGGDNNGDSAVDAKDLTRLKKQLAGNPIF